MLKERYVEYKVPIHMAFIDFHNGNLLHIKVDGKQTYRYISIIDPFI